MGVSEWNMELQDSRQNKVLPKGSWWGTFYLSLIGREGEAVFGILGQCIKKSVSQWSEPKIG